MKISNIHIHFIDLYKPALWYLDWSQSLHPRRHAQPDICARAQHLYKSTKLLEQLQHSLSHNYNNEYK